MQTRTRIQTANHFLTLLCGTLLSDTLVENCSVHSRAALLWNTLAGHSGGTLSWDAFVESLWGTLAAAFFTTCQGLQSPLLQGMFVVLATYHDDLEVPAGVVIMRKERFQELRNKGVSLPHLADYIRLRMMQGDGGWLLDVNVLWLRPPPKQTEELNFHMFSSLRARPGSTWQGKLAEFRKWSTQYLAMPGDELFVATPFYAPASSLWPAELVRKMELHFNDSGSLAFKCCLPCRNHAPLTRGV